MQGHQKDVGARGQIFAAYFRNICYLVSGKSGTCWISTCPQCGKTYKRLDNHLSRNHKGITRAMVDRLVSQNLRHEKFMPRSKPKFFGAGGDKC